MARSRHRTFLRGGRQVRETMWFAWTTSRNVLAAADTATLSHSLNAAALAMRPFTIVRTRGFWLISSDQTGATEDYGASMAFAVVSEQASTIGVTAIPTPIADRGSDLFFVYEMGFGVVENDSSVGFDEMGRAWHYDSKAMRKVNDDQDIIVTIESESLNDGGMQVINGARMLIKLH